MICGTNGLPRKLAEAWNDQGKRSAAGEAYASPACTSGGRGWYLHQQLEACDPLERQDEKGGQGQPPALGVQLQLRNQLPKGGLLLAGGHRCESRALARRRRESEVRPQPRRNRTAHGHGTHVDFSFLLLENQLFTHKSSNNSGFTWLAHENLAQYVTCGKVRIPRVAKSMTQMQDLVIYPAGTGGKVNPRRDRNSSRLGTRAGGMSCLQVARQWEEGAALTRAPGTCWAARQQGRRLAALPSGPPGWRGTPLSPRPCNTGILFSACRLHVCPQNWCPDSLKS